MLYLNEVACRYKCEGAMRKLKRNNGFLGCRTTKEIEQKIKGICSEHNREVSEVLNYLCRVFIEDVGGIRAQFLEKRSVS
jgi:hypothetical protein